MDSETPPPLPSSPPPLPHTISLKLDESNIVGGAMAIISLIRPTWENPTKSKEFNEGLSNKLVGFYVESNPRDMLIVKVFGVANLGTLVDRKQEIETMQVLHQRKRGAELYVIFDNGICYEFINGVIPDIEECRLPKIYGLIAAEMGRWHSTPKGVVKIMVNPFWDKIMKLNQLADETLEQNDDIKKRLASFGITVGWASEPLSQLRRKLEEENVPIVFCHNDVSSRNVVIDEGRTTFIDVEYAGYNYAPFDLANHFMEFIGVSLPLDFSKCPDKPWRLAWITEYLKHLRLEDEVTDITPEKFNKWVELCIPLNGIFWCLWATLQAAHSTIEYDFVEYVGQRFLELSKNIYLIYKKQC